MIKSFLGQTLIKQNKYECSVEHFMYVLKSSTINPVALIETFLGGAKILLEFPIFSVDKQLSAFVLLGFLKGYEKASPLDLKKIPEVESKHSWRFDSAEISKKINAGKLKSVGDCKNLLLNHLKPLN